MNLHVQFLLKAKPPTVLSFAVAIVAISINIPLKIDSYYTAFSQKAKLKKGTKQLFLVQTSDTTSIRILT